MILDVYASRETDDLGVSSADLVALLPPPTTRASTPADAARRLADLVAPGDVVLTLGAGDVTETGPLLLELLTTMAPSPTPPPTAREGLPGQLLGGEADRLGRAAR